MLVKALKNLLEPKAEKIETTQDLRTKCLDKDVCALLLKGSKTSPGYVKDALTKLIKEHPKVTFGAVDSSVLYVLNLEEYLPELANAQPRFVVFQKVSGSSDSSSSSSSSSSSKERLKTSIAALPTNGVSYGQMSNLLDGVIRKTQQMTTIPILPSIKTRTKKLEQEEKAKRERKVDQQRRQQQHQQQHASSGGDGTGSSKRTSSSSSSSSSSGGFFSNFQNDGSAEGRRAERERRRQEHRASNPNYRERTPEEMAEIERQRRLRMEEEAAKWNMAPDDAPEEGDPVREDDLGDVYEEYDGDETNRGGGGEDSSSSSQEDDEDVLDLD